MPGRRAGLNAPRTPLISMYPVMSSGPAGRRRQSSASACSIRGSGVARPRMSSRIAATRLGSRPRPTRRAGSTIAARTSSSAIGPTITDRSAIRRARSACSQARCTKSTRMTNSTHTLPSGASAARSSRSANWRRSSAFGDRKTSSNWSTTHTIPASGASARANARLCGIRASGLPARAFRISMALPFDRAAIVAASSVRGSRPGRSTSARQARTSETMDAASAGRDPGLDERGLSAAGCTQHGGEPVHPHLFEDSADLEVTAKEIAGMTPFKGTQTPVRTADWLRDVAASAPNCVQKVVEPARHAPAHIDPEMIPEE